MKRKLKVLSLVVVAVLLLVIGCFAIFADNPDITVKAGETEAIGSQGNFENPFNKDVVFKYNESAGKYVLASITITSENVETVYNAEEQSAASVEGARTWSYNPNGLNLADLGLSVEPTWTTKATDANVNADGTWFKDAGDAEIIVYNEIDVKVLSNAGDDYTKWFHIEEKFGTFKVKPLKIEIFTGDYAGRYDGNVHQELNFGLKTGYEMPGDKEKTDLFKNSDTLVYASIQYITKDNKQNGPITDKYGDTYTKYGLVENVIKNEFNPNYEVVADWGTLTLYPIKGLTFGVLQSDSNTKVYDGEALIYFGGLEIPESTQTKILPGDKFLNPTTEMMEKQQVDWPVNVGSVKVASLGLEMAFENADGDEIYCYDYTITGDATLTVNPRPVTITINKITATYGDTEKAVAEKFAYTVTGGSVVDTEKLTLDYACDYRFHDSVGEYPIEVDAIAATAANKNYTVKIDAQGSVTVNQKNITIQAADATVQYGLAAPTYDFAETTKDALVADDTLPYDLTCDYRQWDRVGNSYKIVPTLQEGVDAATHNILKNYKVADTLVDGTLTVTKKILNVYIKDQNLVFGNDTLSEEVLKSGWTYEGYLKTDSAPALTVTATCDYTKGNDAKTYTIVGAVAEKDTNDEQSEFYNYDIVIHNGTLTVLGKQLVEIVWLNDNGNIFTYDGTAKAPYAIGRDEENNWYVVSTTSETFVGNYTAYATGVVGYDAEVAALAAKYSYTVKEDYTATNFRINKLTAGEGFFQITEKVPVKFTSASVVIGNQYSINFKVDKDAIDQYGKNFTVVMTRPGVAGSVEFKLSDLTAVDDGNGMYVFTYTNIGPQSMGVKVNATLIVKDQNGNDIVDAREYSILDYCHNMLTAVKADKTDDALTKLENENLVKVIVAMLRYGAVAQGDVAEADKVTYKLDEYVTDYAKVESSIIRGTYTAVENNAVKNEIFAKYGADLWMTNGVEIKLTATLTSADKKTDTMKLYYQKAGDSAPTEITDYEYANGKFTVYIPVNFDSCNAAYTLTIVETANGANDTVGSVTYSVETYASKKDTAISKALVDFSYALQEYTK